MASSFVDHLDDSDDHSRRQKNRHAENGLCFVSGYLIDRPVEPWIRVDICYVQKLSRLCYIACYPRADWKSERRREKYKKKYL